MVVDQSTLLAIHRAKDAAGVVEGGLRDLSNLLGDGRLAAIAGVVPDLRRASLRIALILSVLREWELAE